MRGGAGPAVGALATVNGAGVPDAACVPVVSAAVIGAGAGVPGAASVPVVGGLAVVGARAGVPGAAYLPIACAGVPGAVVGARAGVPVAAAAAVGFGVPGAFAAAVIGLCVPGCGVPGAAVGRGVLVAAAANLYETKHDSKSYIITYIGENHNVANPGHDHTARRSRNIGHTADKIRRPSRYVVNSLTGIVWV